MLSRRYYLSIFDISHKPFRSLWKSASQDQKYWQSAKQRQECSPFRRWTSLPCRLAALSFFCWPLKSPLFCVIPRLSPLPHNRFGCRRRLPPLRLFLQHQGFCLPSLCICDSFSSVPKFLSTSLLYDSIFKAEVDESNIKLKKEHKEGKPGNLKPHVHDLQTMSQLAITTATTQMNSSCAHMPAAATKTLAHKP